MSIAGIPIRAKRWLRRSAWLSPRRPAVAEIEAAQRYRTMIGVEQTLEERTARARKNASRIERGLRKDRRPTLPVGNDGLTDDERVESLLEFRRGVGAKPAPTSDHKEWSDAMADKLTRAERNDSLDG